ncbi:MAG: glycosyltransferase family 1 protein [Microgenomates group bacterium]|jgi:glycosyltransferase involved in cell wall biosynthesis
MNIGFDGSRAFSKNRTGTENYSYQLLKHLAKLDHTNNYYIYLTPKPYTLYPKDWPGNFKFITIPFSRLWTQVGLAKQTFKDTHLDVLFIPSHTLPLIKRPGLKTVVTVHDLGAEYLPKTHQLKQRVYLKLMTDYQLKTVTRLIAVSKATKEDLVRRINIDPKKIDVIYEGYDKSAFKPLKTDEFKDTLKYYDIESNKYFLFVGTIQPRKNLVRLISAYSIFLNTPSSATDRKVSSMKYLVYSEKQESLDTKYKIQNTYPKLVLAGSKGWMSDEIYELPKKLGIEDQVKFLGYVPDENLPSLYNGAIAFLYPSLFEGFGLPILEAMACGCPVLTSNVSSMPEVAGSSAVYVNPYSEDKIAQSISKLFNDKKSRDKLKTDGIAQSNNFSWEKCAKETLSTLLSVGK